MTFNVKTMNRPVAHCCAVMRLSIWRKTGGNVEGSF